MPELNRHSRNIRKGGGIVYQKAAGKPVFKAKPAKKRSQKKHINMTLLCDKLVARRLIRVSKTGRKIVKKKVDHPSFIEVFPQFAGQKIKLDHPIKTSLSKQPRPVREWLENNFFV